MSSADGVFDSVCPLDCPDTCSLSVTVEQGRVVQVDGSHRNPFTDGFICAKVRRYPERVHAPQRVLHPLRRTGAKGSGAFARISWDEAIDLVATRLDETVRRWGGEAILPYHYGGSNGMLNEDGADARFFHLLGASHLEKTICAVPTGVAARALYGGMVGVPIEDYHLARCIVLWGVNPAATSIHTLRHVQQAQRAGAFVLVVDPRRTRTARIADLHLRPRPGTDAAVALGIARILLARGAADPAFVRDHVSGFADFAAEAGGFTPERVEAVSGVSAAELQAFADAYATASPAVVRCGWGLERNRNGVDSVRAVLSLPAIAGKFGVRGGGYTMSMSGAFAVDKQALARPDLRPQPVRSVNMTQLGRALTELSDPPVQALFVYNANPVASTPDQNRILAGLAREDLFTVVHEQVMTDTALYADVVLPATTVFEQNELHKSYGHPFLQYSTPVIAPVGEAIDNVTLFRRLAARLGLGSDDLFAEERLVADALGAGAAEQVRRESVVRVAFDGAAEVVQFGTVWPRTADRRVDLAPAELGPFKVRMGDAGDFPLILLTPASERLINSSFGEFNLPDPRLALHPADAAVRGIGDGDWARVHNDLGSVEIRAQVTEEVPPGVVALPKGMWRSATRNGATSTALIPDEVGAIGGGACFNDARVEVEPLG